MKGLRLVCILAADFFTPLGIVCFSNAPAGIAHEDENTQLFVFFVFFLDLSSFKVLGATFLWWTVSCRSFPRRPSSPILCIGAHEAPSCEAAPTAEVTSIEATWL